MCQTRAFIFFHAQNTTFSPKILQETKIDRNVFFRILPNNPRDKTFFLPIIPCFIRQNFFSSHNSLFYATKLFFFTQFLVLCGKTFFLHAIPCFISVSFVLLEKKLVSDENRKWLWLNFYSYILGNSGFEKFEVLQTYHS